jgi:hypothetical protein
MGATERLFEERGWEDALYQQVHARRCPRPSQTPPQRPKTGGVPKPAK